MNYANIVQGVFLERPNRFIAYCDVNGEKVIAHVKNTGRCKELLVPGATVFLEYAPSSTRKTDYSLITVRKGNYLINMDSQAPNVVALEGVQDGTIILPNINKELTVLKREVTYGQSRFDLYIETIIGQKAFLEVKGVTLEEDGAVMFPDAPTQRGTKHIYELIEACKAGYKAYILFVIQMSPVSYFTPNESRDPEFAQALNAAKEAGVYILAYDCQVTEESLQVYQQVEVRI